MKIRTLLIAIVAFFAIFASVAFTVFESIQMQSTAESQYSAMMIEMCSKQTETLTSYFDSLKRTAAMVSGNENVITYATESASGSISKSSASYKSALQLFGSFCTDETGLANLYLIGDGGKVLMCNDEGLVGTTLENDPYEAFDKDNVYVNSVNIKENASDFTLIVKQQVKKTYLIAEFADDAIVDLMTSEAIFPGGRILLLDPYQLILDKNYSGKLADTSNPEFTTSIRENVNSTGIMHKYNIKGNAANSRMAYITDLSATGWKLIALSGEPDIALKYSGAASGTLVGTTVLMTLVLITAGVVIMIIFTKPLYSIEDTLLKIRRGDHEARIDVMSNNEYGEIARAFNDLIDDIIVSEGRYRTIIEMSDNIIFEWNFATNEVFFSNNFNKKFSYRAPSDHFGDSFLLKCKVHPDDAERYRADLERLSKGEEFKQNEYRWKNIYGDYIWVLVRTSTIRDSEGEIIKVVGVIVDIDRAKKSEKLLTTRASFDSLTGLYNRETIESLVNNEIDLISARKNEFAILFVDVDDFKIFNDKYSHATGDQVLKFTASVIQSVIGEFGIAGRYGGDEFVLCVRNSETNDPARIAQDILQKLKDGFTCDSGEILSVQVSIGISIIRDTSKRVDEIIGMADDAMYKIKKSGKSNYGFLFEDNEMA